MNISTTSPYQPVTNINTPSTSGVATTKTTLSTNNTADTASISAKGKALAQTDHAPKIDPTELFNEWLKRGSNQLEIVLGSGTKDTMLPENKPLYDQLVQSRSQAGSQRERENISGQMAELISFGNKEVFNSADQIDQRMQAVTMSCHLQEQYLSAKNGTPPGIPPYQGPYPKDSRIQLLFPPQSNNDNNQQNSQIKDASDPSLEKFNDKNYLISLLKNSSYQSTAFVQNTLTEKLNHD